MPLVECDRGKKPLNWQQFLSWLRQLEHTYTRGWSTSLGIDVVRKALYQSADRASQYWNNLALAVYIAQNESYQPKKFVKMMETVYLSECLEAKTAEFASEIRHCYNPSFNQDFDLYLFGHARAGMPTVFPAEHTFGEQSFPYAEDYLKECKKTLSEWSGSEFCDWLRRHPAGFWFYEQIDAEGEILFERELALLCRYHDPSLREKNSVNDGQTQSSATGSWQESSGFEWSGIADTPAADTVTCSAPKAITCQDVIPLWQRRMKAGGTQSQQVVLRELMNAPGGKFFAAFMYKFLKSDAAQNMHIKSGLERWVNRIATDPDWKEHILRTIKQAGTDGAGDVLRYGSRLMQVHLLSPSRGIEGSLFRDVAHKMYLLHHIRIISEDIVTKLKRHDPYFDHEIDIWLGMQILFTQASGKPLVLSPDMPLRKESQFYSHGLRERAVTAMMSCLSDSSGFEEWLKAMPGYLVADG